MAMFRFSIFQRRPSGIVLDNGLRGACFEIKAFFCRFDRLPAVAFTTLPADASTRMIVIRKFLVYIDLKLPMAIGKLVNHRNASS